MTVYVDAAVWERWDRRWCHLLADDTSELHAFATALAIERRRFQSKPRRPWVDHYDLDEVRRLQAIALGAIEIDRREVCALIARKRACYTSATASPTATRPPSSTSP